MLAREAAAAMAMTGDIAASVARNRPRFRFLALFFVAYVLGAAFGQWLAIIPGTGITLWPPSGLFIATLVLTPRASWPWWVVAGLAAEMSCDAVWFRNPPLPALAFFTGNALEAVAGAWLVRRVCRDPVRLETMREVLALVGFGACVAPVLSATIGAATLVLYGMQPSFLQAWVLWWVGDATGVLIFAPLALVVVRNWQDTARLSLAGVIEGLALALVFVAVGVLSLSGYLPFAYIIMPPLLWAAVRFEFKGVAIVLALLALLTAAFTVAGVGQFAGEVGTTAQNHVMLQLFLAISALTALIVAALSRQHQLGVQRLKAVNGELEARIAERTANLVESERRLAAVLDALPIGVALVDQAGHTLVSNGRFKAYVPGTIPSRDTAGPDVWEGRDASGRPVARSDYPAARALRGDEVWPGEAFLFHGNPADGPRWTRVAALPFRDERGQVVGATVVLDDIDAAKRAVDALGAGELRLRLAHEAAGLGTWERDLDTQRLQVSPEFLDLLGLRPEDAPLTLERMHALLHPDDRERVVAEIREAIRSGGAEPFRWEYRIVRPDGQLRWHLVMGRLVLDQDGGRRLLSGIAIDITERKAAEERQLLLAREVDHRAKNALAVVQSLVRLTEAGDPASFAESLEGRVAALARAHTLLARERWVGGNLRTLLEEELEPHLAGGEVALDGPELILRAEAVQPLAMSVHELATNAAKYGALSEPGGRVAVRWAVDGEGLHITWSETGGPPIAGPPERRGFGSKLLQASVKGQLGGSLACRWEPQGLRCELVVAASRLLGSGAAIHLPGPAELPVRRPATTTGSGKALRAIVAEDETLLAMEVAAQLRALGCTIDGIAASVEELRRIADRSLPDLAVLDVNLVGESSLAVADMLVARGVPVILATGYGDLADRRWPEGAAAVVLRKPVARDDLARALARLFPCQAPGAERTG